VAVVLVVAACFIAVGAFAADSKWKKIEDDCWPLFRKPKKAPEAKLEACADVWATHSRRQFNSDSEDDLAKRALRYLYESGSDRGASIARGGLLRVGIKVGVRKDGPRRGASSGGKATRTHKRRRRYNPPPASRGDRKEAEKLAKAGVKDLTRKKYKPGVKKLQAASKKNPRSEYALYNLACGYALLKRRDPAVAELQKLADLATDESLERLIRARRDGDFKHIRKDGRFKKVTGYMNILVLNTIGDDGEEAVENIETMLQKLGHARPELEEEDKKRDAPQILFKEHAKAQVPLIAELLNHPRVRIDPLKGKSPYDMIIKWGAKIVKKDGSRRAESLGPDTADKKLNAARRKQNEVLSKPEKAIDRVDHVISTPDRAYNKVTGMGKRAENTVNKAEATGKKIESIGDKLSSL